MRALNTPIDFIAYNSDGSVLLLAEAKTRQGTSPTWAAKLRRNMLAHGALPKSNYFLIATPEKMYGWRQNGFSSDEALPEFTVDAKTALGSYFQKFKQDPNKIGPEEFELLMLSWLTDIANSVELQTDSDPSLKSLIESGLLSSLRSSQVEMNPPR